MAIMHGKQARIYWDAQDNKTELQHGQSWSLSTSHDVSDKTSMQDSWRSFSGGFVDWTATVNCLLDTAGTDVPLAIGDPNGLGDVKAKLELYLVWDSGTPKYRVLYGSAVCTGISIEEISTDIVKVTYTFQGVDALAWSASVPTY